MMKLLSVAVFFVVALAVACGGGGGSSGGDQPKDDEAAIRQVINDFGKAFNSGKASDLHKLLDADSRKGCSEKDLQQLLTLVKALSGGKKFGVETRSVKVNGDKATATIVASIGDEKQDAEENELVKEDGKWRLSFGGGSDCDI